MTQMAPELRSNETFKDGFQGFKEFYPQNMQPQNQSYQKQNQNYQKQNQSPNSQNHSQPPNQTSGHSHPQNHQNHQNHHNHQNHQNHHNHQNHQNNHNHSNNHSNSDLTPASAIAGGREISKNVLYVGNLDKSISEETLKELIGPVGAVVSIKMLNDKNRPGLNYAFVEFTSDAAASAALHAHNGAVVGASELKINFAFQSSTFSTSQTPDAQLYNIFVGDLSPEADDEALFKFFSHFPSLKQAHVMWDMQTSRSRGYGFATFQDAQDAETALQTMGGKSLLGRAVRCNWASHKQSRQKSSHHNPQNYAPGANQNHQQNASQPNYSQNGGQFQFQQFPPVLRDDYEQFLMQPDMRMPMQMGPSMTPQSYDVVLQQAPSWQTTVYLGNIAHFTEHNDLLPLLQNFGFIVDFKLHPDKGCAFVKFDSHERAALAIVQLAGFTVNGRPLKCGWGKSRPQNQYPYPMRQ